MRKRQGNDRYCKQGIHRAFTGHAVNREMTVNGQFRFSQQCKLFVLQKSQHDEINNKDIVIEWRNQPFLMLLEPLSGFECTFR
jgi:hypothetical protein